MKIILKINGFLLLYEDHIILVSINFLFMLWRLHQLNPDNILLYYECYLQFQVHTRLSVYGGLS